MVGASLPLAADADEFDVPLSVNVMSFNIRFGDNRDGANHWDRRKFMVFNVIRDNAPDAVGLQESLPFQVDQILANVPNYAAVDWTPGRGGLGFSTVIYRTDRFSVAESGTFWLKAPHDTVPKRWERADRTCQWARLVEHGTGRAFYFYNTHLRHGPEGPRTSGAKLIVERVARRAVPDPYVVVGDMNAAWGSQPMAVFRAGMVDTYRALHAASRTEGTGHPFTGETKHGKIDYIYAIPGTRVLSADILHYNVGGRYPSDHFPITARLELQPKERRVTFRARAALARGSHSSKGVAFSLMTWDGAQWVTLARRVVLPREGTVSIAQDVSSLYGANRTIVLGTDANGDARHNAAHWVEAVLEVGGAPVVDLIEQAPAAHWHSSAGDIAWGTAGPGATAAYAYNVPLMDGKAFPRTLYVHPDLTSRGFSHGAYGGVNVVWGGANALPAPVLAGDPATGGTQGRVTFRAKAGLAKGAGGFSNGVLFSLMSWDGSRWVTHVQRLVRPDDGTVSIVQDISGLHGQNRTLLLGADANGNSGWDWAHWAEAVIEVDGAPAIDLIEKAPGAHWHSQVGTIVWGTGGPDGTAFHAGNVTMMDGRVFPRTLSVHPDFRSPLNGFSHGAYHNVSLAGAQP